MDVHVVLTLFAMCICVNRITDNKDELKKQSCLTWLKEVDTILADLEVDTEQVKNRQSEQDDEMLTLNGELNKVQKELITTQQQFDLLKQEHNQCLGVISGLESQLGASKASHMECDAQISELKILMAQMQEKLETSETELKAHLAQVEKEHPEITLVPSSKVATRSAAPRSTRSAVSRREQHRHYQQKICMAVVDTVPILTLDGSAFTGHCLDESHNVLQVQVDDLKSQLKVLSEEHLNCADIIAGLQSDLSALSELEDKLKIFILVHSNNI